MIYPIEAGFKRSQLATQIPSVRRQIPKFNWNIGRLRCTTTA